MMGMLVSRLVLGWTPPCVSSTTIGISLSLEVGFVEFGLGGELSGLASRSGRFSRLPLSGYDVQLTRCFFDTDVTLRRLLLNLALLFFLIPGGKGGSFFGIFEWFDSSTLPPSASGEEMALPS